MHRRTLLLTALLLAALCTPVSAEAPRLVCLVSALNGKATLSPVDGPKKPLEVFTRLREGERLDLPRGADVQLAFLQKGVRETWTGPAQVVITADGGQSADSDTPPVIDKLPLRAKPAGGQASSILTQAGEQATAQVRTRDVAVPEDKTLSDDERADLDAVEKQVAQMRATAAPGDMGPDIVLLEELARLGQKRRLTEELRRLREAHPDNQTLAHWEVE
ncbi:conserved hypothetical protein [Solidesulfovibrio fructosivorans JJ]]|uniref:Uncharacterized protein n=1 Tax=Solidesulfovibrio fructosivorans JJ] TaxID=596151 RepID=E1K1D5_SOLFR|nr:hypothetical protein [Solidesulfovibrio fructosivorans]EFL49550.1 conserved hypothetical protein [Solidesulfovibrio fructosivorans JJ]]